MHIRNKYYFCNQVIESNIHLNELPFADENGSFFFRLMGDSKLPVQINWRHHWFLEDTVTISYGVHNSVHWLRFPELADFSISPDMLELDGYSNPGIPENTIRHLLLDQVLPRCMAHQGNLMLHASAVRTSKGLILFTGASGAGKSTLAGYFHRSGNIAVSDDCMLIKEVKGRIIAIPSYSGVRLWQDSQDYLFSSDQQTHDMAHYSSKQRIPLSDQDMDSTGNVFPVVAVIFLSLPGYSRGNIELGFTPISKREGYIELLKQIYQLDVTDTQRLGHAAQSLRQVVQKTPLYKINIPRDYTSLPAARQMILDTILK